jgi:hypothetical protein
MKNEANSNIRFAILLIAGGCFVALDVIFHLSVISRLWPVFIVLWAIGFIGIFLRRDKREPAYLAIAIYFIAFSALALYCNFTSWGRLAYLWPLFITILGLVFIGLFLFHERRYLNILLGLLFVSLSVVFLLVFSLGARYWWSTLILAGLSILISEKFHEK